MVKKSVISVFMPEGFVVHLNEKCIKADCAAW